MPADPVAVPPAVAAFPGALAGDAEWLLTDGAGGYACGSVDGLARRRYHGLWVARPAGVARRAMVVAALDERLVVPGQVTHLLPAHWRDVGSPRPGEAEVSFVRRPVPRWTFRRGEHVVVREVLLRRREHGAPCLLVRWQHRGPRPLRLDVRPLLGWCDADHLLPADERFVPTVAASGASWGVRPNDSLPTLWLTADGVAAFRSEPAWYRGFVHATDRDRGYDHVGDRWTPGVLELDLPAAGEATAAWSLEAPVANPGVVWREVATLAESAWQAAAAAPAALPARLALGADDFLYRADGDRLGVLAGFPWFGEWGRDVFLALPGLTLARGRHEACAAVLVGALPFLRDGLLPNIYGRTVADSNYGSCDAALWWSLAVQRYADAGGEPELVRERFLPAMASIAMAYQRGTDLGLVATSEGLLAAGRVDLNATWMDARIASGPVTPRQGLPVEIQALWYSLLDWLAAHEEPPAAKAWRVARDRCGKAFVQSFWVDDGDGDYLADRVHDGRADRTVRPNMLVAAALPRAPWTLAQRAAVVARANRELVTPRGLRTLSPRDPAYVGRYEGNGEQRDRAYHQGTVWPWLVGFHVEASLRAATKRALPATKARLAEWLAGFGPELERAGLDHVSEVFDGDEPQRPGGTFAQAWNTGELLRACHLLGAPS
jgi:predicted glycogen debranching enzyme